MNEELELKLDAIIDRLDTLTELITIINADKLEGMIEEESANFTLSEEDFDNLDERK